MDFRVSAELKKVMDDMPTRRTPSLVPATRFGYNHSSEARTFSSLVEYVLQLWLVGYGRMASPNVRGLVVIVVVTSHGFEIGLRNCLFSFVLKQPCKISPKNIKSNSNVGQLCFLHNDLFSSYFYPSMPNME